MSIKRITAIMDNNTRFIVTERATGAAAIATSVAPGVKWALREIRVHLSAAGGAVGDVNLTATINSGINAVYDTLVKTQDMTLVTDLEWQPDFPMIFDKDDVLDIAWANGSSRTYGLEVIYSKL